MGPAAGHVTPNPSAYVALRSCRGEGLLEAVRPVAAALACSDAVPEQVDKASHQHICVMLCCKAAQKEAAPPLISISHCSYIQCKNIAETVIKTGNKQSVKLRLFSTAWRRTHQINPIK